ncbi:MAG TPA: hypothetical protein VFM88_19675 [Vicinamibacteria bacterium]|nr:hypothetical protein [Vicinamibacteria bacterium]
MTILLGLLVGVPAPGASQQSKPPAPFKSVYGKLQSVDRSRNGVVMISDSGERLAWQFEPPVIGELLRFKPGDPMIVIYRQTSPNEKRVTALAFPGSATTPVYVNMTGERVVLRSGPKVGGACGQAEGASVRESEIPVGGLAETGEECWCCAAAGDACNPGNETGLGRAFLVRCFK